MVSEYVRRGAARARTVGADLRGGGKGWVLVTVAIGWTFLLGTRFVFSPLLPQYRAEFGISNTTAGFAITAVWIAYAAVQFPSGVVSDRFGERRVLVAAAVGAVVSIAVITTTPSFLVFVLGGVLFGLGTGFYAPPRVTVLSNTFPERSSMALGLTFAAGSIGAASLPFLAGQVSAVGGWRAGFGFVLPGLVVVALALWWAVPEGTSSDGTNATEGDPREALARVLEAVSDRAVLLAWGGIALSLFIFQGLTAFLPAYLVAEKGLSEGTAAALYGLFFVTGAVAQPVAGLLADEFGQGTVLAALATFTVFPLVATPFVGTLPLLAILCILLGFRLGLGPINNGYIVDALPADVEGAGYGFVRTFHMVIGSTGAVVVGAMADRGLFDESFYLLAAISFVTVFIYIRLPPVGGTTGTSGDGKA